MSKRQQRLIDILSRRDIIIMIRIVFVVVVIIFPTISSNGQQFVHSFVQQQQQLRVVSIPQLRHHHHHLPLFYYYDISPKLFSQQQQQKDKLYDSSRMVRMSCCRYHHHYDTTTRFIKQQQYNKPTRMMYYYYHHLSNHKKRYNNNNFHKTAVTKTHGCCCIVRMQQQQSNNDMIPLYKTNQTSSSSIQSLNSIHDDDVNTIPINRNSWTMRKSTLMMIIIRSCISCIINRQRILYGTTTTTIIPIFQSIFLIAGTTIGGGFLALPQSVIIPIGGGLIPSMIALVLVWIYLFIQSILLAQSIVTTYNNNNNHHPTTTSTTTRTTTNIHNNNDKERTTNSSSSSTITVHDNSTSLDHLIQDMVRDTDIMEEMNQQVQEKKKIIVSPSRSIGIVYVVKEYFSKSNPFVTTVVSILLFLLLEATLVAQLSRAGSLYASCCLGSHHDSTSSVSLFKYGVKQLSSTVMLHQYRIGCIVTTSIGTLLTFTFGKNIISSVNTILTSTFLISAFSLYQSGKHLSDWSRCWVHKDSIITSVVTTGMGATDFGPMKIMSIPSFMGWINTNFVSRFGFINVWKAIPTMLYLLSYSEIIPNVCSMLNYHMKHIFIAILVGSSIPLFLMIGWAGFGLSIIDPNCHYIKNSLTPMMDPVTILLQQGGDVGNWLLLLAISAIGTTIFGCYLALESTFDDILTITNKTNSNHGLSQSNLDSIQSTKPYSRKFSIDGVRKFLKRIGVVRSSSKLQYIGKVLTIIVPPLFISILSPNMFLTAIDFAGTYPVLLLFGIIPSLLQFRIRNDTPRSTTRNQHISFLQLFFSKKNFLISKSFIAAACTLLLSVTMITVEAVTDLKSIIRWCIQRFVHFKSI